jgi:hypothetical protein
MNPMQYSFKILFALVATLGLAHAAPVRQLRTLPAITDEVLPTVQLVAPSPTIGSFLAKIMKKVRNFGQTTNKLDDEPLSAVKAADLLDVAPPIIKKLSASKLETSEKPIPLNL